MKCSVLHPDQADPRRSAFEMLRHEEYCVRRGNELVSADARESDEYDRYTTYLVCEEKNRIIGGCRFIPAGTPAGALPIEQLFPDLALAPGWEISRMIVDRTHP